MVNSICCSCRRLRLVPSTHMMVHSDLHGHQACTGCTFSKIPEGTEKLVLDNNSPYLHVIGSFSEKR